MEAFFGDDARFDVVIIFELALTTLSFEALIAQTLKLAFDLRSHKLLGWCLFSNLFWVLSDFYWFIWLKAGFMGKDVLMPQSLASLILAVFRIVKSRSHAISLGFRHPGQVLAHSKLAAL